jgi:cyclopropane-fatty-acyl-phospholipid synthase
MEPIELAERAILPDPVDPRGHAPAVGKAVAARVSWRRGTAGEPLRQFIDELRRSRIAVETDAANEQHYEVPSAFFERVLGAAAEVQLLLLADRRGRRWPRRRSMLDQFCRRRNCRRDAGARTGLRMGLARLWIAEKYPACRVTAVSNSRTQREFILAPLGKDGLEERGGRHGETWPFLTPGTV